LAEHITHDPAYNTVDRDDFPAMVEVERYMDRHDDFDAIISGTVDHFWDPNDERYLQFDQPFNLKDELLMPRDFVVELNCAVAEKLDEGEQIALANESSRWQLSSILHGEQGALSLSVSLAQILRDPGAVAHDLDEGWTTERVALEINGVVTSKPDVSYVVDEVATEKKRSDIREERKRRAVPFREWWAEERVKVEAQENMDPAVLGMWATSMELSPKYAEEIRRFWNLPADFVFEEQ